MLQIISRILSIILLSNFLSISIKAQEVKPVVYSYWAGWANAEIPKFSFDGLFLAFPSMNRSPQGTFYTDYNRSGNFQLPSNIGPYATWNSWVHTYYPQGARSYVSYGGGTNENFRDYVINANYNELTSIAEEIKNNVKLYYFDGVDLDIEGWWLFSKADNTKFAKNLAALIKVLRASLDNDLQTQGKPITLAMNYSN